MRTRAAVAVAPGKPLEIRDVTIDKPGPRNMPAAPLMHGTGMWLGAMIPQCLGGAVVTLPSRSLDSDELLRNAEQVLALRPDSAVLAGLDIGVVGPRGKVGVVGPQDAGDTQFEVRAFFPGNNGLAEDPVTGSLNAALAQWLIGAGLAPTQYVASQGTRLGRAGRVFVEQDGDTIWVGGSSVTCVSGEVLL